MTEERWKEVKEDIKDQFDIEYEGEEDLVPGPGTMEVMEFQGPTGLMRVEFESRPRTLGRKVSGARRGNAASTEHITYSADEIAHRLHILSWNEDEEKWDEVKADLFS